MSRPPIIILGMHRSGTSMVVRLLEQLGLFSGWVKEGNAEALFFIDANKWLLRQSGGSWDCPLPIRYLLENGVVRGTAVEYLDYLMKTPQVIPYLGMGKYLRYRSPRNLDIPWGWKDPRNTFTLPIWLDLFPDAKVLHVYRHGVDVASSLKVRMEKRLKRGTKRFHSWKPFYWMVPKIRGFTNTLRCASLEQGFSLWEEYMDEARRHSVDLGDRFLEVKYEDFLAGPDEALEKLCRFCDLGADPAKLAALAGQVRKSRAYAYREDPVLDAFATGVAERLAVHGY